MKMKMEKYEVYMNNYTNNLRPNLFHTLNTNYILFQFLLQSFTQRKTSYSYLFKLFVAFNSILTRLLFMLLCQKICPKSMEILSKLLLPANKQINV